MALSFSARFTRVAVDEETGRVSVREYVGALDVGRAINPMTVRGKLHGAAVQGTAGELFEEFPYDEDGQPPATSLVDYLLPACPDVPEVESLVFEYAAPDDPLGVKGAGNPSIVSTYAAVANAVSDVLQADVTRLPLRPHAVHALLCAVREVRA